jgi:membrane protein DedA with SNARE-associated domain
MLGLLDPTHLVETSGYAAIFILSVLQSCCVPTSSELVMGFAGVLASEGKLSLAGAIAAGVAGEVVGAYIAYFIGRTGGRALIDRYGRYILVSHHDLDRVEAWYTKHGDAAVFGGRLIPVVRNFVALPAGIAEVPPVRFGVLTFFGSAIWLTAMALIGYGVGSGWHSIMRGFSFAGYLLLAAAVIFIAIAIYHRYRSYHATIARDAAAAVPAERAVEATPLAGGRSGESRQASGSSISAAVESADALPGQSNPRGPLPKS